MGMVRYEYEYTTSTSTLRFVICTVRVSYGSVRVRYGLVPVRHGNSVEVQYLKSSLNLKYLNYTFFYKTLVYEVSNFESLNITFFIP